MVDDHNNLENLPVTRWGGLSVHMESLETEECLSFKKRSTVQFSRRCVRGGRFECCGASVPGPDSVGLLRCQSCPQCGARLLGNAVDGTSTEPVRITHHFHVKHGVCPIMGCTGRGHHADLEPCQQGATAHCPGPQVMVWTLTIDCHFGLSLCKVPAVIQTATGIVLGQSALTQAPAALSAPGATLYTAYWDLRESVRSSPRVNRQHRLAHQRGLGFSDGILPPCWRCSESAGDTGIREWLIWLHRAAGNRRQKISHEGDAMDIVEQEKCLTHFLKKLCAVEDAGTGCAIAFILEHKAARREAINL